jgi:hypothetical protein
MAHCLLRLCRNTCLLWCARACSGGSHVAFDSVSARHEDASTARAVDLGEASSLALQHDGHADELAEDEEEGEDRGHHDSDEHLRAHVRCCNHFVFVTSSALR